MTPTPTPTPIDQHQRDDRRLRTVGLRFAQGLGMGGADIIPGISGGTVALIVGIYTRLIAAIRTLVGAPVALVRGDLRGARAAVTEVPWWFTLPVAAGLVCALGIGSVVLPPLLEHYPVQTEATFFGLIVASLSVPWREATEDGGATRSLVGLAAVCAVLAFLVMGLPETLVADPPLWRVLLSAMVAICAMILPGVSGAFLLLALGIYEPTLEAVRSLDVAYIGTFVLGAAVGLGGFSKVLAHLLEHRKPVTMAALTGLMVGALRLLWPWGRDGAMGAPDSVGELVLGLAFMIGGFALVTALLVAGRRRHVDI